MVRNKPSGKIDSRSARLRLPIQRNPYWTVIAKGEAMGYHRPRSGGGGTWFARYYDSRTRKILKTRLGTADDYAEADERDVLTYSQAQTKAREWFEEMRSTARGEIPRVGPLTVAQAWEAYAEDAERRGKKGLPGMRLTVAAHILPAFGSTQVVDLTQWMIEKWHSAIAKSPARVRSREKGKQAFREAPMTEDEKRARRATANRILSVLKAVLNFAKRRGLTRARGEAWREVRPFEGTNASRQRFLSPEEAQRLVNACPQDFRLLVQGALFTGARFSELARMIVADFNDSNGKIYVGPSKNSPNPRYVVLTEEGRAFFRSITTGRRGDEAVFLRGSRTTRNRHSARIERPWRKSEQSRAMQEACEAAGLEPLTFHELRHTHASGLVNNGVPLAFVAAQLGHSDTRMVEKHYGHLAPSAMADAIRALAPKLGIFTGSSIKPLEIKKG